MLRFAEGVDRHKEHLILIVATVSADVDREVLALVSLPVDFDFEPVVA